MSGVHFLFRIAFEVGLIIGPHLGYFSQYLDIKSSCNTAGYARLVSLILLISYTLRIFYYFGERFATALLFQSIGGVVVHTFLIYTVLSMEEAQWNLSAGADAFQPAPLSASVSTTHNATSSTTPGGGVQQAIAGVSESTKANKDDDDDELGLHPLDKAMFEKNTQPTPGAATVQDVTSAVQEALASTTSASLGGINDETNDNDNDGAVLHKATVAGYTSIPTEEPAMGRPENLLEDIGNASPLSSPGILPPSTTVQLNGNMEEEENFEGSSPLFRLLKVEAYFEGVFHGMPPSQFIISYVTFLSMGFLVFPAYYFIVGHFFWTSCATLVGYAALGFEALLVLPQILKNARRHSTRGLDRVLVATWVGGDSIKIVYFALMQQPLPFLLCGAVQLVLDVIVIFQLLTYRD